MMIYMRMYELNNVFFYVAAESIININFTNANLFFVVAKKQTNK